MAVGESFSELHKRLQKPTPLPVERRDKKNARESHWQQIRRLVKARDGNRCRVTGLGRHEGRIEVHHVTPRSLGRKDSTENCCCACAYHHALFKASAGIKAVLLTRKGCDGPMRFEAK